MPLIVFNKSDVAGSNIAERLEARYGFEKKEPVKTSDKKYKFEVWESSEGLKMIQLETRLVDSEYLSQYRIFDTDLMIFASKHKSESAAPCFATHVCGNWGEADLGGKEKELALSSAKALKCSYKYLYEHPFEKFPAYMEVTHHGPTSLPFPSLFIEIGSEEKAWGNAEAGDVIADAIMQVCKNYAHETGRVSVGIGGTHYVAKFSGMEMGNYMFSHIAPKYALASVDLEMVRHAIEKTKEKVELMVIERKSVNAEGKNKLVEIAEKCDLEYELV